MKPKTVLPSLCEGFVLSLSERRLSAQDFILYALGTGAAQDPLDEQELKYCFEKSKLGFCALPTFATTLAPFDAVFEGLTRCPGLPEFNPMLLLHGEHSLQVKAPLREGQTLVTRAFIKKVSDKRSGALLLVVAASTDKETGVLVCENEFRLFIRGIGGFEAQKVGSRSQTQKELAPAGAPPITLETKTPLNLALLYRLSGDVNPLHADKELAALGGFERPILHGLCTLGIASRLMILALLENDPTRFRSVECRFSAPVFPGDVLRVCVWPSSNNSKGKEAASDEALFHFQVENVSRDNEVVVKEGRFVGRRPAKAVAESKL